MSEVVKVSEVEKLENLRTTIQELFQKRRYEEITNAIGMHSTLIDPLHTMQDQSQLYRYVLNLLKIRISKHNVKNYSAWLAAFPALLAELAAEKQIVTDEASAEVLFSHHSAYGPFRSLDEFFFWSIKDRMLSLEQIVAYVEKTVKMQKG